MKQEYTLTVYTESQIQLLSRIAIIFSRRKIKINCLNTSSSAINGIDRFTIKIKETEEVVIKTIKQLEKQIDVLYAFYCIGEGVLWHEMGPYLPI